MIRWKREEVHRVEYPQELVVKERVASGEATRPAELVDLMRAADAAGYALVPKTSPICPQCRPFLYRNEKTPTVTP